MLCQTGWEMSTGRGGEGERTDIAFYMCRPDMTGWADCDWNVCILLESRTLDL